MSKVSGMTRGEYFTVQHRRVHENPAEAKSFCRVSLQAFQTFTLPFSNEMSKHGPFACSKPMSFLVVKALFGKPGIGQFWLRISAQDNCVSTLTGVLV